MRLKLFVSESTDTDSREKAFQICSYIQGCQLEVIDVNEEPQKAQDHVVFSTPTIIYEGPPTRRVVGTINNARAAATYLTLPEW